MTAPTATTRVAFELSDRFSGIDGPIALTGIQAVVRVLLDQRRADALNGLVTAGLMCGYRGSPVGGLDQAFEQNRSVMDANDIRFVNGVNEDLAATVVWGSQLASLDANSTVAGVTGMWYGKGPGVDRSGDALRHANLSGVSPNGGVLAVAGDDPSNKSSTIPSASEWSLSDLAMPVLFPGNVQEVLDYGRFGYELSRFAGAWVGMKLQTNVADAYATVDPCPQRLKFNSVSYLVDGQPWNHTQSDRLLGATSLQLETEMYTHRLRAAEAFATAQQFDRTVGAAGTATRGIIAAGTTYYEVIDALARLGMDLDRLAASGVRIYKPAMIWPLPPHPVGTFVDGLSEVLVVEEKRPFVERQLRDLLYHRTDRPSVLGKSDADGAPLIPFTGSLMSDDLLEPLRAWLERFVPTEKLTARRTRIPLMVTATDVPTRSAYFCSGCPHNRSTVVPEGSVVGGGIGCHSLALDMDRDVVGLTQMGGEGAQWVGLEPFTADTHRFQNIGDGTLAHSGSLAIRQACAAGSNITYKVLYNDTVAMTGGQDAAGHMTVPDITRWLEAEGVTRTVVVAADPDRYPRKSRWAATSRVEHRDRLDDVQRELRDTPGVTALVYDQACAAELRRSRKRSKIATPSTRVLIDEAICEGCGDCGVVSNCASVHPVMTPFGRKTRIDQNSCNLDLTCLGGNCPAFVTVEIDPHHTPTNPNPPDLTKELADPVVPDDANLVMVGIGGTGVVTMSQIMSTAALLDGRHADSLDQTGLAQKGGAVVSNLRITSSPRSGSNYVGDEQADTLLMFDLIAGLDPKNLSRASPDRTVAIASTTLVPTGEMIAGRDIETFPPLSELRLRIDQHTLTSNNVLIDAGAIATDKLGSAQFANALLIGVAYQRGQIPVTGTSIENAIELNGTAVQGNLAAFRLGRDLATADNPNENYEISPHPLPDLDSAAAQLASSIDANDELADVLTRRIPELIDFQNYAYARQYVADIASIRDAELAHAPGRSDLSIAVARNLYKLMAYKDEYEVARLALRTNIGTHARDSFGPNAKISYRLHPPTLKALGQTKKISLPEPVATAAFRALRATKRLRATKLDPFGRSAERRTERKLIGEYRNLIEKIVSSLNLENYDEAIAIAALADQIRGYDTIKLANVETYRNDLTKALNSWDPPATQSPPNSSHQ